MNYRTVMMYTEIVCFIVCVAGWILVCSTMPTEIWTWSEVGSIVLTTSNYFSNLWKDCISDSTGVSDCKGIPSMLALSWDIHMCRALIIISIILAFFGCILVMVGMRCTKLGGTETVNARVTFAGGMNYLVSGLSAMTSFSYFGNKIRSEFDNPNYKEQKFELGVGLFVGWGGSTLLVVGGLILSIFGGKDGFESSPEPQQLPPYLLPAPYEGLTVRQKLLSSVPSESTEGRKSLSSVRSSVRSSDRSSSRSSSSESRASSVSVITKSSRISSKNAYV